MFRARAHITACRPAPSARTGRSKFAMRLKRIIMGASVQTSKLTDFKAIIVDAMGTELGITVNCNTGVDVRAVDCHGLLAASRTYSDDPELVGILGEAVCRGLLQGGITPVIKHIPGHGRAKVDSHLALPVAEASHS